MKVLHISYNDCEGAGLCAMRIHKSLRDIGIESKMLVFDKRLETTDCFVMDRQKYRRRQLISRGFSFLGRKLHIDITDQNRFATFQRLHQGVYTMPTSEFDFSEHPLIREADIIQMHWFGGIIDYPSFFKKVNKPIVFTCHDENLFFGLAHNGIYAIKNDPLEQKYKAIKEKSLLQVKHLGIVCLSQDMKDRFRNENILKKSKTVVIGNSVDCTIFKPYESLQIRKDVGISDKDKVFVLTAYDIDDPNKGLDKLILALEKLDLPNYKILAIGRNTYNIKSPHLISVGLVSSQDEMAQLYSCGNFYIMSSLREAFGQSATEAMACGLPVVSFPVSATPQLIRDYNGVICNGYTVDDLVNGIKVALSKEYDPAVIRNDMINRFSPRVIAEKYKSLYDDMLNR